MKKKGIQSMPLIFETDRIIIQVDSKTYGLKNIIIDNDDYDKVSKFTWHINKDTGTGNFYAQTHDYNDKIIRLHRFIMNPDSSKIVDHINHDTLDNRKCNLRICTRNENNKNALKRKDYKYSKYKGVKWHEKDKRYHARIRYNGKRIYLGGFKTEEQAAIAYNEAAIKYHGDYACLNIIE